MVDYKLVSQQKQQSSSSSSSLLLLFVQLKRPSLAAVARDQFKTRANNSFNYFFVCSNHVFSTHAYIRVTALGRQQIGEEGKRKGFKIEQAEK